ncbi:recombination protein NinG [Citrobacter koseri]|uniref:recombination protein NinG n=1 Tax=Citrobacter koseri TaxID=545 RepID=UPI0019087364|nr:recombination protein NinG [Citrobacter koseri]MBJ8938548.1 recombination protein NinG [Citrobacter koseri]
MRKPTRRSCKICKTKFTATYDNVWWCCPEHGYEYSQLLLAKKKLAADRKRKLETQQERRSLKVRKDALKSKSQWDKEAQAAFNRYIRIRDEGKPCVSCGSPLTGKSNYLTGSAIDASHYRSRGAASHLKFNVFNVNSACTRCNRQLSGNVVEYRIRLIERIGLERVERLEADNEPRRFDIPYLQRIKSIFTRKSRELEKRRARRQEAA